MLDKGAQEVVVFMMACHSGGLVDAFKQDGRLNDFKTKYPGRTLFIMASSRGDTNSSTNAGSVTTDAEVTGGGEGTGGSAFGNALWRAWNGEADKPENGGNDDGIIQLSELIKRTTVLTKENSGGSHTPEILDGYADQNLPLYCIKFDPKSAANPLCRTGTQTTGSAIATATGTGTATSTALITAATAPTTSTTTATRTQTAATAPTMNPPESSRGLHGAQRGRRQPGRRQPEPLI